ncbi:MAG: hypothetical protein GY828_06960 [Candidatus Gracilibacteria bacterium]|nr:hypothetical protein [Candidatus Gracilibacteria bacterium]
MGNNVGAGNNQIEINRFISQQDDFITENKKLAGAVHGVFGKLIVKKDIKYFYNLDKKLSKIDFEKLGESKKKGLFLFVRDYNRYLLSNYEFEEKKELGYYKISQLFQSKSKEQTKKIRAKTLVI